MGYLTVSRPPLALLFTVSRLARDAFILFHPIYLRASSFSLVFPTGLDTSNASDPCSLPLLATLVVPGRPSALHFANLPGQGGSNIDVVKDESEAFDDKL